MIIKNNICLAGIFITPLALIAYFTFKIKNLDAMLIPLQGTIYSFESRGSHSTYRKVVKLEEYPANLVRYYEGANMLFVKNFRDVIYEPPPESAIEVIYNLHPTLRPKPLRQVNLYFPRADQARLQQVGAIIPYFNLQPRGKARSAAGYYFDIYVYINRYQHGTGIIFGSLLLFLGCCIGASWWLEQHKKLLLYPLTIIVIHALMLIF